MKEIVVESLVRTTEIITVEDDKADDILRDLKDSEKQRELAKDVKKKLGLDDVQIKDVKVFVRDIDEKPKKLSKRKCGQVSKANSTKKTAKDKGVK